LEFPFNIFATAEASDFKFGTRFGLSDANHKITPKGKSGRGHGLGEHPKIMVHHKITHRGNLRFPFNISATTEVSDFKFGMQLGFAKGHHKITPIEKLGVALG